MLFTDASATTSGIHLDLGAITLTKVAPAANDGVGASHPLRRSDDHATLMLARLLWHASVSHGSDHSGAAPLDVVRHWLGTHQIAAHLNPDEIGCWLYAALSENDLLDLQNHMLLHLGQDVFIAYLCQDLSDPASEVCWRNEIDQSARAAALVLHTRPIACMHPAKANALALFRQHASTEGIHFEAQSIWHLPTGSPVGHELLARIRSQSTASWIVYVVGSHDSITLAKLALARAHERLSTTGQCYISVNLSASDFLHPTIRATLEQWTPCKRQRLVLELTEWQNPREARGLPRALAALRNLGVRIAIDDFGAGYSSTVVLREIEFDLIKLDMSLVKSRRRSSMELIRWVTQCAHEMSATVVAEGIETQEDLAAIMDLGVPYGQGWLLDGWSSKGQCHEGGCNNCPKNKQPEHH